MRPFSEREFDCRRRIEILDASVYAATPEDVLLAKLEWAKLGESERQIRDAAGIIEIQGENLDERELQLSASLIAKRSPPSKAFARSGSASSRIAGIDDV